MDLNSNLNSSVYSLPPTPPRSESGEVSNPINEDPTLGDHSNTALVVWRKPEGSDTSFTNTQGSIFEDRAMTLSRLQRDFSAANTALTYFDEQIETWVKDPENKTLCGPGGFGLPTDHDLYNRREQAYNLASSLQKEITDVEREIAREQEETQRKLNASQTLQSQTDDGKGGTGGPSSFWSRRPWRSNTSTRTPETRFDQSTIWSSIWNAKDTAINWALGGLTKATGLDQYGTSIKFGTAAVGAGLGLWMASNAFSNAGQGVNQFMSAAETFAFLSSRGPWSAAQGFEPGTIPRSRSASGVGFFSRC